MSLIVNNTLSLTPIEGTINVMALDSENSQAFIAHDILTFDDGSEIFFGDIKIKSGVKKISLPGLSTNAQLSMEDPITAGSYDNTTQLFYVATNTTPIKLIALKSNLSVLDTLTLPTVYESPVSAVIDKANQKLYMTVRENALDEASILKINLTTLSVEAVMDLGVTANVRLAIDETRGYLYSIDEALTNYTRKIDLATFSVSTAVLNIIGSLSARRIAIDVPNNLLYLSDSRIGASPPKLSVYKIDAETMTLIDSREITEFGPADANEARTLTLNGDGDIIYISAIGTGLLTNLRTGKIARIRTSDLVATHVFDITNAAPGTHGKEAIFFNNNWYLGTTTGGVNSGSGSMLKYTDNGAFSQTKFKSLDFGDQIARDLMLTNDRLYIGGSSGTLTEININRFTKIKNTALALTKDLFSNLCFETSGYVYDNGYIYAATTELEASVGSINIIKVLASTLATEGEMNLTAAAEIEEGISISGMVSKDGFLYAGLTSTLIATPTTPTTILKVNLNTMTFDSKTEIDTVANGIIGGFLGKGDHAYFINDDSPAKLFKVKMSPLSLVDEVELPISATFDMFANAAFDKKENKAYILPSSSTEIIKVNLNTMVVEDVMVFSDGRPSASGFVDVKNRKLYVARLNTITDPSVITQIDIKNFEVQDEIEVDIPELFSATFDENCGFGYFASFTGPTTILKLEVSKGVVEEVKVSTLCKIDEYNCVCTDDEGERGVRCTKALDVRKSCDIGSIIREDCGGRQPKDGTTFNTNAPGELVRRSDSAFLAPITLCNRKFNVMKGCNTGKTKQDRCKTR